MNNLSRVSELQPSSFTELESARNYIETWNICSPKIVIYGLIKKSIIRNFKIPGLQSLVFMWATPSILHYLKTTNVVCICKFFNSRSSCIKTYAFLLLIVVYFVVNAYFVRRCRRRHPKKRAQRKNRPKKNQ